MKAESSPPPLKKKKRKGDKEIKKFA